MIKDNDCNFENERIKFQFLLRNLPVKERAAWLQVCGNQSELQHLKQWINAKKFIQEYIDNQ